MAMHSIRAFYKLLSSISRGGKICAFPSTIVLEPELCREWTWKWLSPTASFSSSHKAFSRFWRTVRSRPTRGGLQEYIMPCEPGNLISPRRLPSLSQHQQHFLLTAIAFWIGAYTDRFNQICTCRWYSDKYDNILVQLASWEIQDCPPWSEGHNWQNVNQAKNMWEDPRVSPWHE